MRYKTYPRYKAFNFADNPTWEKLTAPRETYEQIKARMATEDAAEQARRNLGETDECTCNGANSDHCPACVALAIEDQALPF